MTDRSDPGVTRMSQLLLTGWTMLADHCPNVGCAHPLMSSRRSGVIECANCAAQFARADRHGSLLQTRAPLVSAAPPLAPEHAADADDDEDDVDLDALRRQMELPAVRPTSNATSAQMGQLLLKGWAMLQDVCPVCSTPLMRNPDNRSECFCVSCNATVVTQAEHEARLAAKEPAKADANAAAAAAAPVGVSLAATLHEKLAQLHKALVPTDPVRDAAQFNELCSSIQYCAKAIEAVKAAVA
jgi:uncharacterized Zn finger protein (UPF0148 family)